PTTIGKGAFIGCDTVLIAPVHVGPGAVTGAGSVVPKGHDVPPHGLVMGVPARPCGQASAKDGHPDGQNAKDTKRLIVPSAKTAGARPVKPSRPARSTPPKKSRAPARAASRPAKPVRRRASTPALRNTTKRRGAARRSRGRSGKR
ncbi:MAG: hypothetical protein HYZ89_01615, partial [Candidatus Omnitrophica bacterium]|nr:hypothetical protein [Candidatus Omnitrophota bacterium]